MALVSSVREGDLQTVYPNPLAGISFGDNVRSMKKLLQILTVTFAITMLTGYVVYSQVQQYRMVASSSKSIVMTESSPPREAPPNTNPPVDSRPAMLAPGSKAKAPLVSIGPPAPRGTNLPIVKRSTFAPGSKSYRVLDFDKTTGLKREKSKEAAPSQPVQKKAARPMVAPGSKSAAVFDFDAPATIAQQKPGPASEAQYMVLPRSQPTSMRTNASIQALP